MSYVVIRALAAWTDPETVVRKSTPFKSTYDSTLRLLREEADHLDAEAIFLQLVCNDGDVRLDGALKVHANVRHPGVAVSMDTKHGPLRVATDAFTVNYHGQGKDWQANLRAIALGLESLRRLDRYGITRRGEQYSGWKALPPGGIALTAGMTDYEALNFLGMHSGIIIEGTNPEQIRQAYKRAARLLHPDQPGGSTAAFQRLQEAKRVLDAR